MRIAEAREMMRQYTMYKRSYRLRLIHDRFHTTDDPVNIEIFPADDEAPLGDYDQAVSIGRDICTASEGVWNGFNVIDAVTGSNVLSGPTPLLSDLAHDATEGITGRRRIGD